MSVVAAIAAVDRAIHHHEDRSVVAVGSAQSCYKGGNSPAGLRDRFYYASSAAVVGEINDMLLAPVGILSTNIPSS